MQTIKLDMEKLSKGALIELIMLAGAVAVNQAEPRGVAALIPPATPAKAPKASKPAKQVKLLKAKPAAKAKPGAKRSPAELGTLTKTLFSFIASNSGLGVQDLAKSLGKTTKELTLPIRKLLAEKKITSKGQKRATKYFATAKPAKAA